MRSDTSILVEQIFQQSNDIQIRLDNEQEADKEELQELQMELAEMWKELENMVNS